MDNYSCLAGMKTECPGGYSDCQDGMIFDDVANDHREDSLCNGSGKVPLFDLWEECWCKAFEYFCDICIVDAMHMEECECATNEGRVLKPIESGAWVVLDEIATGPNTGTWHYEAWYDENSPLQWWGIEPQTIVNLTHSVLCSKDHEGGEDD